jgi:hypothetical protein
MIPLTKQRVQGRRRPAARTPVAGVPARTYPKGFEGSLTKLMAEMETAAIAATGLRCLSSQLQSSFGAGSRMHGGSDDALTPTPPLAADPPVDADPPGEADPTPDP